MDLVIVPFHDMKKWEDEGYRTRDAHLYQNFFKDDRINKILIINRPTSLAEVLIKRKSIVVTKKNVLVKTKLYQIAKINEKTFVLDILVLDFFKVLFQGKKWWATSFSYKKTIEAIKKAIISIDMDNPILFLQNPMSTELAKKLELSNFGFDAIDNWLDHPQMSSIYNIVNENYKFIDKNAKFITTVSENLLEVFSNNSNKFWLPNGVDKDHFQPKEYYHSEIKICYIGKIQDRVDMDIVEQCLQNFPQIQFDFIGPILSQKKKISNLEKKYSNFSLKGDTHYSKLAEVIKSYDIGIIPHRVDEFTNSMNPLKLYEYLAAGLPVITTNCAGVSGISEFVYISDNKKEFIRYIYDLKILLENDSFSPSMVSNSLSKEVFWSKKTEKLIQIIEESIEY